MYLVVNELNDWIGLYGLENETLEERLKIEGVYSEDIAFYAYKVGSEIPEIELDPQNGELKRTNFDRERFI